MLRRLGLGALFGAALVLAAACATSNGDGSMFGVGGAGGDDDDDDTSSGPGGPTGPGAQSSTTGDFIDGGTTGTGGGGPVDDCSEAAKLIYVVGSTYELYSFHPPTKQFKEIGYIDCDPGGFSTPFSMAVDRSGTAWVLYNDGSLYNVDTTTADCKPTGYIPNQAGFSTFGMGFVSDKSGGKEETLYIGNYSGYDLGKIDVATMKTTKVGDYKGGQTGPAEITGTGDARLFGFFSNTFDGTATIAEIDKATATIISAVKPSGVSIGSGWAFAFWGGDFYLFTAPDINSRVTQYKPSDQSATIVVQNVGFTIVGAGVSTCAPVEPPK